MFFWGIYEIFRTGFTRNTRECRLLQLVVAGKCFDQKMFFKEYLIRFDIQWHVLLGIKCKTEVSRSFTMCFLVCTWFVRFTSLLDFFIWEMSTSWALSRLLMQFIFQIKKFLEGGEPVVAQVRVNVHETMGRKSNCKLNFFSMYFVWNNEEIHLSFKNSEK